MKAARGQRAETVSAVHNARRPRTDRWKRPGGAVTNTGRRRQASSVTWTSSAGSSSRSRSGSSSASPSATPSRSPSRNHPRQAEERLRLLRVDAPGPEVGRFRAASRQGASTAKQSHAAEVRRDRRVELSSPPSRGVRASTNAGQIAPARRLRYRVGANRCPANKPAPAPARQGDERQFVAAWRRILPGSRSEDRRKPVRTSRVSERQVPDAEPKAEVRGRGRTCVRAAARSRGLQSGWRPGRAGTGRRAGILRRGLRLDGSRDERLRRSFPRRSPSAARDSVDEMAEESTQAHAAGRLVNTPLTCRSSRWSQEMERLQRRGRNNGSDRPTDGPQLERAVMRDAPRRTAVASAGDVVPIKLLAGGARVPPLAVASAKTVPDLHRSRKRRRRSLPHAEGATRKNRRAEDRQSLGGGRRVSSRRRRRGGRGAFTIVIPPPNVTGSLHMGHALNNTLQDIRCASSACAARTCCGNARHGPRGHRHADGGRAPGYGEADPPPRPDAR